jgi:hypothetical protein
LSIHIYGGTTGGANCPAEKFLGFLDFTNDRLLVEVKFDFFDGMVNNDD